MLETIHRTDHSPHQFMRCEGIAGLEIAVQQLRPVIRARHLLWKPDNPEGNQSFVLNVGPGIHTSVVHAAICTVMYGVNPLLSWREVMCIAMGVGITRYYDNRTADFQAQVQLETWREKCLGRMDWDLVGLTRTKTDEVPLGPKVYLCPTKQKCTNNNDMIEALSLSLNVPTDQLQGSRTKLPPKRRLKREFCRGKGAIDLCEFGDDDSALYMHGYGVIDPSLDANRQAVRNLRRPPPPKPPKPVVVVDPITMALKALRRLRRDDRKATNLYNVQQLL